MADNKLTVVQHIYNELEKDGVEPDEITKGIRYYLHHFDHMEEPPEVFTVVRVVDEVYLDWKRETSEYWDVLLAKCALEMQLGNVISLLKRAKDALYEENDD